MSHSALSLSSCCYEVKQGLLSRSQPHFTYEKSTMGLAVHPPPHSSSLPCFLPTNIYQAPIPYQALQGPEDEMVGKKDMESASWCSYVSWRLRLLHFWSQVACFCYLALFFTHCMNLAKFISESLFPYL